MLEGLQKNRLVALFRAGLTLLTGDSHEERAVGNWRLWNKVGSQLEFSDWLLDIYHGDGGEMFALVTSSDGWSLRQIPLTITSDDVVFGDPIMVTETFAPVSREARGSITISRTADGEIRWFMIASTAVLNRVGEIDSRRMYDKFEKRFKAKEFKPFFTIRHSGEALKIGEIDFVGREGYCLILSGTMNRGDELAEAAAQSLEEKPDYWGVSIGFESFESEIIRIGENEDIPIPVHTDGLLIEASMLRESDCAAWFTQVRREGKDLAMTKAVKRTLEDDLLVIFNGDKDKVRAYLDKAGNVNRAIEEKQLVRRDGEAPPAPAATAAAAAPNDSDSEGDDAGLELELTDETIEEIAAGVTDSDAFKKTLTDTVTSAVTQAIAAALEPMKREIADMKKTVTGVQTRAAKVMEDLDADAGKGGKSRKVALRSSRPRTNDGKRTPPPQEDDDPEDDDIDDDEYGDDDENARAERAAWQHRNARADNLLANMP